MKKVLKTIFILIIILILIYVGYVIYGANILTQLGIDERKNIDKRNYIYETEVYQDDKLVSESKYVSKGEAFLIEYKEYSENKDEIAEEKQENKEDKKENKEEEKEEKENKKEKTEENADKKIEKEVIRYKKGEINFVRTQNGDKKTFRMTDAKLIETGFNIENKDYMQGNLMKSATTLILPGELDEKDVYVLTDRFTKKYIDKKTGLLLKKIDKTKDTTTKYIYNFDNVSIDDIKEPTLEGYEREKANNSNEN